MAYAEQCAVIYMEGCLLRMPFSRALYCSTLGPLAAAVEDLTDQYAIASAHSLCAKLLSSPGKMFGKLLLPVFLVCAILPICASLLQPILAIQSALFLYLLSLPGTNLQTWLAGYHQVHYSNKRSIALLCHASFLLAVMP
jgi:hypothetical protein